MALFSGQDSNQNIIKNFIPLCLFAGIYSILIVIALYDHRVFYFYLAPLSGFLVWFFYIRLLNDYLNLSFPIGHITKYVCVLSSTVYVGVFAASFFFENSYFFKAISLQSHNVFFQLLDYSIKTPTWDFALLAISFSFILVTALVYVKELYYRRKDELLLFFGVLVSVYTTFNDAFVAKEVFDHVIPLACVGFLIEVMRFFFLVNKETSNKINKLEDEIINISSLAELGTLTVGISHDIKNPLTVIKSVEVMLRKKHGDCKENQLLRRSTDKLNSVVDTYLKMIYKGDTEAIEFQMSELIKDTIEICQHKINSNQIKMNFLENELTLSLKQRYNPILLGMTNIIGNACDAIKNSHEKWIKLECDACKDWVELRVIDSGHGISEEYSNRIFERQFSTKNKMLNEGSGSGLGLYLVQQLMKEVGGEVNYLLYEGHTCFSLKFPRSL